MEKSSASAVKFRGIVTAWASSAAQTTPAGRLVGTQQNINFGFPAGGHGDIPCWTYAPRGAALVMHFGFYSNFTPDDLICKVSTSADSFRRGIGASLQFNSGLSVEADPLRLVHSGRVTVRTSVARATLLDEMEKTAPHAVRTLGINGVDAWPIEIGRTSDLPTMLDRLFLYAYAIEQAKRSIRREAILPPLLPETAAGETTSTGSQPASNQPTITDESTQPLAAELDLEELGASEGEYQVRYALHKKREAWLRQAKIQDALRQNGGRLVCEVPRCGFDFEKIYGQVGRGYAQVHHLVPLASRNGPEQTRLGELLVVCANCHAMIHRNRQCRDPQSLIVQ